MRSVGELLTLMLNNMSVVKKGSGLCFIPLVLYNADMISSEEKAALLTYIRNNRPIFNFIWRFIVLAHSLDYYWKPGRVKPRKRWLKRHIRRNRI